MNGLLPSKSFFRSFVLTGQSNMNWTPIIFRFVWGRVIGLSNITFSAKRAERLLRIDKSLGPITFFST